MSYCRLLSTLSLLLLFVISIILFLCSNTTTRIVNNTDDRFESTLKRKKSVSTIKQCTTVSITEDILPTNSTMAASLVQSVSCPRLLSGDEAEIRKLRKLQETENLQQKHDMVEYLKELSVCNNATAFVHHSLYVSPKELDFPLAFVFLLSFTKSSPESVQHFIKLLKHLYREHDVYCFHISSQTPPIWTKYIKAFASCFPNMLIATSTHQNNNAINDHEDMFSSYQQCLKTLVINPDLPWKYVINLKGTELPLITNREMVEALSLLQDSNVITQGTRIEPHVLQRSNQQSPIPHTNNQFAAGHAVPYNLTLYTSAMESHSIALSQDFVGMLFRDVRAIQLVKYLHNFSNSFEVYFTTMNHVTDVPGGVEKQKKIKGNRIRFPQITKQLANSSSECGGLCVLSTSDFKWINAKISKNKKTTFFVDKYSSMFDNVVMDCIELQLIKRNMAEYKNDCHTSS